MATLFLGNKRDLLALCLSGTYCHKTGTRPPSSVTSQQPVISPDWAYTCDVALSDGSDLLAEEMKIGMEFYYIHYKTDYIFCIRKFGFFFNWSALFQLYW